MKLTQHMLTIINDRPLDAISACWMDSEGMEPATQQDREEFEERVEAYRKRLNTSKVLTVENQEEEFILLDIICGATICASMVERWKPFRLKEGLKDQYHTLAVAGRFLAEWYSKTYNIKIDFPIL